jgi:type IV pilus assembly protein PilB
MGVPSYLVASSVVSIMAQRLVRVVCQKCKHPYTPTESLIEAAGITREMAANANFAKGSGCGNCSGTGFRGRLGIFELMMMSTKIREMTFNAAPTNEIRQAAVKEGMRTLYWDGIDKVLRGVTTLEEVLRAAKRTESE